MIFLPLCQVVNFYFIPYFYVEKKTRAPAPDFLSNRLRLQLLIFFPSGSGSFPGTGSDFWLSFKKYFFLHKLLMYSSKKYKKVRLLIFKQQNLPI